MVADNQSSTMDRGATNGEVVEASRREARVPREGGNRSRHSRPLLASPPQAAPVLAVSSMSAWSSGA